MKPRQLTILGVGLLGGSIGLAVRSAAPNCRIVGWGHRASTLDDAMKLGAIDVYELDLAAAVRESDLVILCAPVGLFENILKQIAGCLHAGCTVTDVGSTKRSVVALAERILPSTVDFVGSHPMAGSEKRGVEFARADLFRQALCILTPTAGTRPAALERVEGFWRQLGMRTTRVSPQDHDRLLADISHLPHLLAAVLMSMQEDAALDLCGPGFLDSTRIAGGDGGLWRDIFLDNAQNLRGGVARLKAEIDRIAGLLEPEKGEQLRQWLDAAAARRAELIKRRSSGSSGE
ncbi:MAG: prephenate dehydrogenase [Planctomycetota bacterium]|nr:prephenate dehydrogenase [Planctomycetota bacterium]